MNTEPSMEQVRRSIQNKPELAKKYASQIPYLTTVSIRNEYRIVAEDIIQEGEK